jgi:hypothetical protein
MSTLPKYGLKPLQAKMAPKISMNRSQFKQSGPTMKEIIGPGKQFAAQRMFNQVQGKP